MRFLFFFGTPCRTSDKKITLDCGILDLIQPSDEIMADRYFDIDTDIPCGVELNIPPFLNGQPQLNLKNEMVTRSSHTSS